MKKIRSLSKATPMLPSSRDLLIKQGTKEYITKHSHGYDPDRICADCEEENAEWASLTFGCVICIRCSGVHRSLGVHVSRIKSLILDSWTDKETESLVSRGNVLANKILEGNLTKPKPTSETPLEELKAFIVAKYCNFEFVKPEEKEKELKDLIHTEAPAPHSPKKTTCTLKQLPHNDPPAKDDATELSKPTTVKYSESVDVLHISAIDRGCLSDEEVREKDHNPTSLSTSASALTSPRFLSRDRGFTSPPRFKKKKNAANSHLPQLQQENPNAVKNSYWKDLEKEMDAPKNTTSKLKKQQQKERKRMIQEAKQLKKERKEEEKKEKNMVTGKTSSEHIDSGNPLWEGRTLKEIEKSYSVVSPVLFVKRDEKYYKLRVEVIEGMLLMLKDGIWDTERFFKELKNIGVTLNEDNDNNKTGTESADHAKADNDEENKSDEKQGQEEQTERQLEDPLDGVDPLKEEEKEETEEVEQNELKNLATDLEQHEEVRKLDGTNEIEDSPDEEEMREKNEIPKEGATLDTPIAEKEGQDEEIHSPRYHTEERSSGEKPVKETGEVAEIEGPEEETHSPRKEEKKSGSREKAAKEKELKKRNMKNRKQYTVPDTREKEKKAAVKKKPLKKLGVSLLDPKENLKLEIIAPGLRKRKRKEVVLKKKVPSLKEKNMKKIIALGIRKRKRKEVALKKKVQSLKEKKLMKRIIVPGIRKRKKKEVVLKKKVRSLKEKKLMKKTTVSDITKRKGKEVVVKKKPQNIKKKKLTKKAIASGFRKNKGKEVEVKKKAPKLKKEEHEEAYSPRHQKGKKTRSGIREKASKSKREEHEEEESSPRYQKEDKKRSGVKGSAKSKKEGHGDEDCSPRYQKTGKKTRSGIKEKDSKSKIEELEEGDCSPRYLKEEKKRSGVKERGALSKSKKEETDGKRREKDKSSPLSSKEERKKEKGASTPRHKKEKQEGDRTEKEENKKKNGTGAKEKEKGPGTPRTKKEKQNGKEKEKGTKESGRSSLRPKNGDEQDEEDHSPRHRTEEERERIKNLLKQQPPLPPLSNNLKELVALRKANEALARHVEELKEENNALRKRNQILMFDNDKMKSQVQIAKQLHKEKKGTDRKSFDQKLSFRKKLAH
eukprot:CAMPEP_0174256082 /NCGR_PEP_ID=MMETSP0439-20130205/5343_1 /TAXON_ID=0 /ORGANISM="Stereomyxa ramosa, Strain Chinc5" /LENGTH=1116 /DNA_ID=CAMNT_0015338539 /DNA_START=89 /DNA_END=3439 /DNA_ORIENTATION=-